jgi:hypothetical protein
MNHDALAELFAALDAVDELLKLEEADEREQEEAYQRDYSAGAGLIACATTDGPSR